MKQDRITRREFLAGAGALLTAAASPALLGGCGVPGETSSPQTTIAQTPGIIYSPDTLKTNRIPPGQTQTSGWPQLENDGIPNIDLDDWSLSISGEIENPVTLSYADFSALHQEKVFSDVHCVTRWTRLGNLWAGVGSQTLTELAALKPTARYVIISAYANFTTNLELADFLQEDVIFATKHDGDPLSAGHGGPMRLVVPQLYFWKSAKWVTGIEFTAEDHPGFWETRGYNNHGDPWKEERYS